MNKNYFKEKLLSISSIEKIYEILHEINFDNNYRKRKLRYEAFNFLKSEIEDKIIHQNRLESKLKERGYTVKKKVNGNVNIYCYIPSNWSHQDQIYFAASKIGVAHRFDYKKLGYSLNSFIGDRNHIIRTKVGRDFILDFIKNSKLVEFDLIFCYGLPWDICPNAIKEIKERFGLPIVNISLDDKNWWDEIHRGDKNSGLKNFSQIYDLNWVSSKISVGWHWIEGGQAVYLPEGVNTEIFCPQKRDDAYKYDVIFDGSKFGHREKIMKVLKKTGLNILVAGPGWSSGPISESEMIKLFSNSKIILGVGDMGYSRWLTNLKGRDFEATSVGGGVYLTTFNSDLAECFKISSEILCYRGVEEMVEVIMRSINNDDELGLMARLSREKCIRDHQWTSRFNSITDFLKITS